MSVIDQARTAYDPGTQSIRSAKSTEYEAISRVTRALKAASVAADCDHRELAEALHQNRKLWAFLGASVADTENALPADLRAQIFYLSEFSIQHSRRALRKEVPLDALIDINLAMMQGLRAQTAPT